MSELQSLLSQKETLSEQLRRITETCEGIENETNAAKVAALNEEQLKLTAQKRELQNKTASIERTLSDIGGKIQELSGSGVEKLLNAIKNQRWFFFKNKPKVLFDRDTGLLWASLEYFPYKESNNEYYGLLSEVQGLINSTNSNGIDGYTNWKIPTPFELWKMIEDKTFPYQEGDNWYIKGAYYWCVYYNGNYQRKDLDYNGAMSHIDNGFAFVIPCSAEVQPVDYENNISPNNKVYTEKEKLQFTLNIFVTNELEPIFTDATLTELYRQIYIVKPEVQKKLAELQQQIDALNEVELISSKLDWIALKTKFDIGADSSPIRYAVSVKNLTAYLIEKFDDYVAEKFSVLAELKKFALPRELIPNTDKVRADLKSFHEDAVSLYEHCTDISSLNELHDVTRPTFALVTETLTEKIRREMLKVELYETLPDFVNKVFSMFGNNYNDLPTTFETLLKTVREIILELTDYVFAGHLRKKIGEVTAAELVIENYRLYIDSLAKRYREKQNQTTQADIIGRLEAMQKNMMQVVDGFDEEVERSWLKKRMGRDRLLDF